MRLNSNQIAEILPHRYPFALVDRIDECEPGVRAKGVKCVSVNEQIFCGHFPQAHVMPGVLILEAMAQVGAVAILTCPEDRGKLVLFGGVKNARFKRKVVPGDVLELKFGEKLIRVEVLSIADIVGKADADAMVEEYVRMYKELSDSGGTLN